MGKLELKINVRHSDRGATVRTITKFNNCKFTLNYNSLASSFSFDYYFDPKSQDDAENICVSHFHEAIWFYNGKKFMTAYILNNNFKYKGVPEWVKVSGYSKSGNLNDSDTDADYSPETDGLTLWQIITKLVQPFNASGIKVIRKTSKANVAFVNKDDSDVEEKLDGDTEKKTAKEVGQNIGSYISELAKQMGVVLSHDENGNVLITTPNTKADSILNLDYSDRSSEAFKIPGIGLDFVFNGQAMHTKLTAVQQADEETGVNASVQSIRNPLIPIGTTGIYRPKTFVFDSGSQFTMDAAVRYELGREIREAVKMQIELGVADVGGNIIKPNNTITLKEVNVFAYKKIKWFIESVDMEIDSTTEKSTLNCVLPYGYDFDYNALENVWVDPHKNLPII